jgi:hypothetical protein
VRDRQAVLRGQLTELLMGEAHNYWIRIIIKQPGAVSTQIPLLTNPEQRRRPQDQAVAQIPRPASGTRAWMVLSELGSRGSLWGFSWQAHLNIHFIHSHPQLFHKRTTPRLALDRGSPDHLSCQRFSPGAESATALSGVMRIVDNFF